MWCFVCETAKLGKEREITMRRILRKELVFVLCTYAVHASVYASQTSLWEQLNTTGTVIDVFINLMSAVCASMASTAFRLKSVAVDMGTLFKELAYGVTVGVTAGIITYAIAEAAHTNKFLQLALVTLAGWGGAKIIESWTAHYFGTKSDKD